jgi:hypothetical protein
VKDLVNAFAQFSRLPKMLNRKAILDTLVAGSVEGRFVLRLTRPDKSVKTYWREAPDDAVLKEPGLEVVLPEAAELSQLTSSLLVPTVLPQLWERSEILVQQVRGYFGGGHVVKIAKEGYEELVVIPKAGPQLVDEAIQEAVKDGRLWLTLGPSSVLGEEIPAGLLSDQAQLQAPPSPIAAADLLPENLPAAWQDEVATALNISDALSTKAGRVLPWITVRRAIDGALSGRLLERVAGQWPTDYSNAQSITLRVPAERPAVPPPLPPPPRPGVRIAEAELRPNQIQDLADSLGELIESAAGHELRFTLRVELESVDSLSEDVVEKITSVLVEVSEDLALK